MNLWCERNTRSPKCSAFGFQNKGHLTRILTFKNLHFLSFFTLTLKVRLSIHYGFCCVWFFFIDRQKMLDLGVIYITGLSSFIFFHCHILQFYIVLKINNLPSNLSLIFYFYVRDRKIQNQEQGVLRIRYA